MSRAALNIHASVAVVGEVGVLVRGASGSGKTALVLALVEDARGRGRFARLVADDRALIEAHGGRLVARPHPALAGLAERRGIGIVRIEHEAACVLGLAVDLAAGRTDRMPEPEALACRIAGARLPRLAAPAGTPTCDVLALIWASGLLGVRHGPPIPISLANPAAMHKIAPEPNGRAGGLPGTGMSGSLR